MHWAVVAAIVGVVLLLALAVWIYNRRSSPTEASASPSTTFAPANKRTTVAGKPASTMITRNGKLMSVDPTDESSFGQIMMLQLPEWDMRETCGYMAPDAKEYVTIKSITVNGIQYDADEDQCVTKLCHGDVIEGLPGQLQQYKLVLID